MDTPQPSDSSLFIRDPWATSLCDPLLKSGVTPGRLEDGKVILTVEEISRVADRVDCNTQEMRDKLNRQLLAMADAMQSNDIAVQLAMNDVMQPHDIAVQQEHQREEHQNFVELAETGDVGMSLLLAVSHEGAMDMASFHMLASADANTLKAAMILTKAGFLQIEADMVSLTQKSELLIQRIIA